MAEALSQRLKVKPQLMRGEDIALGPGKVDLLEAIGRAGSISAAAREMGLSYRRAWMMVDTANRCFKTPLVARSQGGAQGGGAELTDEGRAVIATFRQMQAELEAIANSYAKELISRLT